MLSALWGQSTIKGPKRRKLAVISSNEQQTKKVDVNILMTILGNSLEKTVSNLLFTRTVHQEPLHLFIWIPPLLTSVHLSSPSSLFSFYWWHESTNWSTIFFWCDALVPQNTTTGTCSKQGHSLMYQHTTPLQ